VLLACAPQDFLDLLIQFNKKRVVARVQVVTPVGGAAAAPRRAVKRRRGEQAQEDEDAARPVAPQAPAPPVNAADAVAVGAVTMLSEPGPDCDIKVGVGVLGFCSAYLVVRVLIVIARCSDRAI
jgi:hypothetical protein